MSLLPLLAEATVPVASFTPTEYALAGVVLVLGTAIVALAKLYATEVKERRIAEVDAYKQILPLVARFVDVVEEVQRSLKPGSGGSS